jgi:hypothetical protein
MRDVRVRDFVSEGEGDVKRKEDVPHAHRAHIRGLQKRTRARIILTTFFSAF